MNALAVAGDRFESVYEQRGVVLLGWIGPQGWVDAEEEPQPQPQPHYVEGELVNMKSSRTFSIDELLR